MSGGQITFGTNETDSTYSARIDVYGWVTLDRQRLTPNGACINWCEEARRQLGLNFTAHLHYGCMALYSPTGPKPGAAPVAKFICDNACKPGEVCTDTCPEGSGLAGVSGEEGWKVGRGRGGGVGGWEGEGGRRGGGGGRGEGGEGEDGEGGEGGAGRREGGGGEGSRNRALKEGGETHCRGS